MSCDVIKRDVCYLLLFAIKVLNFEACGITLNHLKTNSAKFAHYRPKIQKVIEFFEFQS